MYKNAPKHITFDMLANGMPIVHGEAGRNEARIERVNDSIYRASLSINSRHEVWESRLVSATIAKFRKFCAIVDKGE